MSSKQNDKARFIAIYANGARDYFNHPVLLQAQRAAHKKAADLNTIVISVIPFNKEKT
jgi:hypothetical protein